MTTASDQPLDQELSKSTDEVAELVEASRAEQQAILEFRDSRRPGAPLPPKSLRKLPDGRRRYLNLQHRLWALADRRVDGGSPAQRYQSLSISLLAAATIYDNYLSLLTILKDDTLRRLLNQPQVGYDMPVDEVWAIAERLGSGEARANLHRLLDAWTEAGASFDPTDDACIWLRDAIESSVSIRYARDASLAQHLPSEWRVKRRPVPR